MAEYDMEFIYTKKSKLKDLPIANGQIIFVEDANTIYLDFNNKRTGYTQFVILDTDNERTSMTNSPEGICYFVKNTKILWSYVNSNWVQLTTNPAINFIYKNGTSNFPTTGEEYVLYIDTELNVPYRWDTVSNTYQTLGVSKNEMSDYVQSWIATDAEANEYIGIDIEDAVASNIATDEEASDYLSCANYIAPSKIATNTEASNYLGWDI